MKRIIAILILTLATVTTVFAASAISDKGTIEIYTNVSDSYVPNTVEITFSIATKDKDAAIAASKNKEIAQKAIASIKAFLNLQAGDTVQTQGFNVLAQYSWKNNKKTFENYEATNTFKVKLKDTSKLGKVINAAVNAGVTRVGNLNYTIEETDAYCTELISRAAKAAKTRADIVSKSIGYKITGLKTGRINCSTERTQPMYRSYTNSMAKTETMSTDETPVEAGILKINATFNGEFFIQ